MQRISNGLTKRVADVNSAFPAGLNAAATWSKQLMKLRGNAMGMEHRGKGVDMQLGPVAGPLGRTPEGGRNWEGKSMVFLLFVSRKLQGLRQL